MAIKALRRAQQLLVVWSWQMLSDPIINSFFNSTSHERRESIPLSLFLVFQWDRSFLMQACTLQEQIWLGGLLYMLWSGLRLVAGQRLSLHSLSWCITELRGSCYKNKTSTLRQTWAIQARAFLSPGAWSWVTQWLVTLVNLWSQAHTVLSDAKFLLPMTLDDQFLVPLVPMPYSQALHWIRHICTLPWKHFDIPELANPGEYTLHSLKTTTLSGSHLPAQQGLVTGEQRHRPEHHCQDSMRLYSCDDTAGPVALQNTLLLQVQQGLRSITPLHSGSQWPTQEPAVSLKKFPKTYQAHTWLFLPSNIASSDPIGKGCLPLMNRQGRARQTPMVRTPRTPVRVPLHQYHPQSHNSLILERRMKP